MILSHSCCLNYIAIAKDQLIAVIKLVLPTGGFSRHSLFVAIYMGVYSWKQMSRGCFSEKGLRKQIVFLLLCIHLDSGIICFIFVVFQNLEQWNIVCFNIFVDE